MDPSIQEEEEAKLAQKENDVKLKAILEGLLFLVGDDGLTVEQASKSMDISTKKAEQLFDALQKDYVDDSRGFEIERYGSRYRFLSKAFVHEAAKKLFSIDKISKLSNAALETLAIIAYKQPITRVEIEEIRGVGADVMIRKLEARGLIKEEGRSDAPGRPFLYSVTDEFMDAFKLLSLDELPDLPEFNKDNNDDLFHS
ncbi:SMC-Scp complex subunit ScpB [Erysipelotrichaceae bacterium 7770_A6]|nr:SMC-Scp complex subunit ScpB [Erysipelotrichaceae bacterium 7770_A6]